MGLAEILQSETLTRDEQKPFLEALSLSGSDLDAIIKELNQILQDHKEKD
jgi:hypothetical protein